MKKNFFYTNQKKVFIFWDAVRFFGRSALFWTQCATQCATHRDAQCAPFPMTNGSKDVLEGHAHSRAEDSSKTVEPSRPRTRYNTHLESRWRTSWGGRWVRSEVNRQRTGVGRAAVVRCHFVSQASMFKCHKCQRGGNTKMYVLVLITPP